MSFEGNRLRTARKFKKLTIDTLIAEVNEKYNMKLNNGMVSKWENNKVIPRIDTISVLAEYLDVPVGYLLGNNDLGNLILDLRLKKKYKTRELSIGSGVSETDLNFIEAGVSLPADDYALNSIGFVFGVEDLRSYANNQGIFGPVTNEELNQEKTKNLLEQFDDNFPPIDFTDLHVVLEGTKDVRYKHLALTSKQKSKLMKIIEILLEDE
ncbi:helix-turn-helix transcriptional regulator [Neobacillus drentensis]|uniref:helix-turn-helix domain-containing protein n=1 Tax=Neobacillus drentensis TaxID=220684 RepID=UPI0030034559